MKNMDTQWRKKRTRRLWTEYTEPGSTEKTSKTIKVKIMGAKKSLDICRMGKQEITKEKFFDTTIPWERIAF